MSSARIPPVIWAGIVALVSLAVPTWRFGRQFLLQFFVCPFQFFIVPLWLLAYFSVRTGRRQLPPLVRRQTLRWGKRAGVSSPQDEEACAPFQITAASYPWIVRTTSGFQPSRPRIASGRRARRSITS